MGHLATLANGAGDVRGAVHGVAGGEQERRLGLAGGLAGREPPVGQDREAAAEHGGVRGHADGGDDHVRVQGDGRARDGLHRAAPGGVGGTQPHLGAAEAGNRALGIAKHLGRGDEEAELHALLLGVHGLHVVRGHLVPRAAVGNGDVRGAQAAGHAGGVHGDVAAAHHHDTLARELGGVVQLHAAQEVRAAHDAEAVLARDAKALRAVRAHGHDDGVEALVAQRRGIVHAAAGLDLHAEIRDVLDVPLHHRVGQAVGRDAQAQEAAGDRGRLVDLHGVAQAGQLPRGREAGGAGANDGDALAVGLRALHAVVVAGRIVLV